jgi:hypothetical protein
MFQRSVGSVGEAWALGAARLGDGCKDVANLAGMSAEIEIPKQRRRFHPIPCVNFAEIYSCVKSTIFSLSCFAGALFKHLLGM